MNEILDCPVQTGSEQLTNHNCDIVFDHVGFAYQGGETVLKDVSLYGETRDRSRHWSGHPAAARPPFPGWRRGSGISTEAESPWAAWMCRRSTRKS